MKNNILVILLLSIFTLLAVTSIIAKSGTCDEIAHHIATGAVFLEKGDLKMSTESPPLPRYIVAAPIVFFLDPVLPANKDVWRNEDRAEFSRDFFFKYNNNAKQMLFASRLAVIILGIILGILLFIWSNKMYGERVALFTLFIYCFSPNILAHTRLATTDIITTFFMFLSLFTFWLFLNNPGKTRLALAGLCLGLGQLSKYSMLILYPIFVILYIVAINKDKNLPKRANAYSLLLIFLISILTIWAGYGFRIEPILVDAMRAGEKLAFVSMLVEKNFATYQGAIKPVLESFLLKFPMPLGEHILGFFGVLRHSHEGHLTYFCGQWSQKGNSLYFLVSFLIKTPIPITILFLMGLIVSIRKRLSTSDCFLIIPFFVYFIIALGSNLQVGIRHLLPIYPLCFVISARSIGLFRYRLSKTIIAFFSLWIILGTIMIYPHFLSYFNEIAGGPDNGWRYLRDSNIDWGQDLPALSTYIKENKIDVITLAYFGEDLPKEYGIKEIPFKETEHTRPENKVYAISVQGLDSVKWAKDYTPDAKMGYSIFVYDFRDKKL
ncbi:MAG: glycosyltransferase family 39 protein [Candidatus Orphnella occulta]|nr:glycosyltransferase family 39 protein [Candidatus Orphnella occulta]